MRLPNLVSCEHGGIGQCIGVVAFVGSEVHGGKLDVAMATCPDCTQRVYAALKAIPGLKFPQGRVPE